MKKLPINITASVFDIINTVLYTFSWPLFIIADNSIGDISDILLGLFIVILYSLSLAGLGVNIASLVMSKKNNFSIVGPILGIIGNVLFMISLTFLAFPAIVLLILATIFTLLQRPATK